MKTRLALSTLFLLTGLTVQAATFKPIAASSATCGANFSAAAGSPIAVGTNPQGAAVGDLNHDGNPDIVSTNAGDDTISILLGDGTGSFSPAAGSPRAVGDKPYDIAIGDFDKDGHPDLAVTNEGVYQYTGTVTILLGIGDGTFTEPGTSPEEGLYGPMGFPRRIVAGDYDRDGEVDLAVARVGDEGVTMLLGQGNGNFTPLDVQHFATEPDITAGDINRDGFLDIAAPGSFGFFGVGEGIGGGLFNIDPFAISTPNVPYGIASADLDLDGRLDLVYTAADEGAWVILGNGDMTFDAETLYATVSGSGYVAIGDLNLDGKQDVAMADIFDDNLTIMLGDGTGAFAEATGSPLGVGGRPVEVVIADLNNDGRPDLTVVNQNSDTLSILLNECDEVPCPTAALSHAAGSPFVSPFEPTSVATADFNWDGDEDLAIAARGSDVVRFYSGNGNGGFSQWLGDVAVGDQPASVVAGDFDRNGTPDLAVANFADSSVTIVENTGASVSAVGTFPVDSAPVHITSADVNLDGILDLLVSCGIGDEVTILIGDGALGFTASSLPVVDGPSGVATGDFDHDGNPDLAVATYISAGVKIYLGDGTGAFSANGTYGVTSGAAGVTTGDFDHDGHLDFATISDNGGGFGEVHVFLGDGTGSFSLSLSVDTGDHPTSVATGDFNADGNLDLSVTNAGDPTDTSLTLLLGDGLGGFSADPGSPIDLGGSGDAAYAQALADVNHDGRLDAIVTVRFTNDVAVLLGSCSVGSGATLSGMKYYDANTNGQMDAGEAGIANWLIDYSTGGPLTTISTLADGTFSFDGDAGTYSLAEQLSLNASWIQTGNLVNQSASADVTLNGDKTYTVAAAAGQAYEGLYFGNVCIGAGGAAGGTNGIGFWTNKNGAAMISGADLAMLAAMNLRNADGSEFNPATYSALKTWLSKAKATNMAWMLSAQMAALRLSVFNGLVDGTRLIYAPGTLSANANGFATVNAVIAEADAELGVHGTAMYGDAWRAYQETVKNALESANLNKSFVQTSAASCPAPF